MNSENFVCSIPHIIYFQRKEIWIIILSCVFLRGVVRAADCLRYSTFCIFRWKSISFQLGDEANDKKNGLLKAGCWKSVCCVFFAAIDFLCERCWLRIVRHRYIKKHFSALQIEAEAKKPYHVRNIKMRCIFSPKDIIQKRHPHTKLANTAGTLNAKKGEK